MAGIINGQAVDQIQSNAAWLAKNGDDATAGKVTLANADTPNSGSTVPNAQRELNSINAFTGHPLDSAPTATPSWTNNDVGSAGNTLKDRADLLTERFNPTTGHTHDGSAGAGPQLNAGASLVNVPLQGYFIEGTDLLAVTGTTKNVSTEMTGKTASGGSTSTGVVVTPIYNRVILKQASGANEGDSFTDLLGNVVYGRITNAGLVWTLSFYVMLGSTETAYNFTTASDIRWYYQELFNPMLNPPVYSELAIIPSDNVSGGIATATTLDQGKVSLATSAVSVGSANAAGTPNAVVANADHVHQGVHSIFKTGDSQIYGDVELSEGTGITLTRTGNKITIDGAAALQPYQEQCPEIPDGINAAFTLTYAPYNQVSTIVWVDGVRRENGTAWTLSGSTITFNVGYIPTLGQRVDAFYLRNAPFVSNNVTPITEYRTISSGEATAKQLTLLNTPMTANEVLLSVKGGGAQFYGDDFTVSGSVLDWNGLGLDGLVSAGDKFILSYFYQ